MWESISSVLNGNNGILVIIAVVVIILVLIYLSKNGGFALHTSFLSLGGADRERDVIRHQIESAHAEVLLAMDSLNIPDDWHTKYIFERVYDKVVEWVIFNHISTTPLYIESKFMAVYNLCTSLGMVELRENENKEKLHNWVRELVHKLVDIRKYYSDAKKGGV